MSARSPMPGSRASSQLTCATTSTDDSQIGIVSQIFSDPGDDVFDSAGAQQVTPMARTCKITTVQVVAGYFNGAGPANSFEVTFSRVGHGVPTRVLSTQTLDYVVTNEDVFTFRLGSGGPPTWHRSRSLAVTVRADMAFASGGEWGWHTSTNSANTPATWENPGDGFATGCTTWQPMQSCFSVKQGPSFMVTLGGRA